MQIKGKIWKEKSMWIAEIQDLGLITEDITKKSALEMFHSLIEEKYLVDKKLFEVLEGNEKNTFVLRAFNSSDIIPLILKGLRNTKRMSIQDVADKLGFRSRSSYAKYEHGDRSVSLDMFDKLVKAITDKEVGLSLN